MILPASVGCAARSIPPVLLSIAGACAVGFGSVGLVSIPPVEVPISGVHPMPTGTVGLVAIEQATVTINGVLPMTVGDVMVTTDAIFDVTGVLPMTTGTVGLVAIAPATITISGVLPMTTGTVGLTAENPPAEIFMIEGDTGFTDISATGASITTYGSPGSGPTLNGYATFAFDGTDDGAYTANSTVVAAMNASEWHMFAVVKMNSSNDSNFVCSWPNTGSASAWQALNGRRGDGTCYALLRKADNSLASFPTGTAHTVSTWHVIHCYVKSAMCGVEINGTLVDDDAVTSPANAATEVQVGTLRYTGFPSGANFANMDLAHLSIFGAMTSGEVSSKVSALQTKYGI